MMQVPAVFSLSGVLPSLLSRQPTLVVGQVFEYSGDLEKIKKILGSKDRFRWVFTGDSITMGAKHTHGYRSYVEIFRERLQWELGRSWDIVINTEMSGIRPGISLKTLYGGLSNLCRSLFHSWWGRTIVQNPICRRPFSAKISSHWSPELG